MSTKFWMITAALVTTTTLALAPSAQADTVRMLLETDANMDAGAEFVARSYASAADLVAGSSTSSQFIPMDVAALYSVAEIAYDGAYRVLYESNIDLPGGQELFLATYDSWDDLLSAPFVPSEALSLNVGAAFSIHGFTYDGQAYRLLLESDLDRDGGVELVVRSYATLADFRANTNSDEATLFNVPSDLSVAGLGFDDGAYRLLLESEADINGSTDFSLLSYANFGDLLADNPASSQSVVQSISRTVSVHGFEFEPDAVGPGPGVPEPATWAMMILGFGAAGSALRRRKCTVA